MPAERLVGQTLDGYEILALLGKQGETTLYRARSVEDGRVVLLSLLPAAALAEGTPDQLWAGLDTIAALNTGMLVLPQAWGERDGQPFVVWPELPGGTLADRLEIGPLSEREMVDIAGRVAVALDVAHEAGFAHGALSPGAIQFDLSGRAHVAGLLPAPLRRYLPAAPGYEAPETHAGNGLASPAVDVYQLGALVVEMLRGAPPDGPGTPEDERIRDSLARVVGRALEDEPAARFATAADFVRALAAAAGMSPGRDLSAHVEHDTERLMPPGSETPVLEAAAFRPARPGGRWFSTAMAVLLVFAAWFVVGTMVGLEGRRQVVQGERAAEVAEAAAAQATATASAADALATATAGAVIVPPPAATATPTPTAEPTPTPTDAPTATPMGGPGALIAYVSDRDGDADIYILNTSTGEELPITENDVPDAAPAWSPDGRLLAYASNDTTTDTAHIFVVGVECITRPEGCNGAQRELTMGIRADTYPVWDPTGARIAFLSNESQRWFFRYVSLDGEETTLTQLPERMRLLDWSPSDVLTFYGPSTEGEFEILQLPLRDLSPDRVSITQSNNAVEWLDFSADGTQAVYAAINGLYRHLFIADVSCDLINRCNSVRITEDPNNYYTPQFSPDATQVVTVSDRAGSLDLWLLATDGSDPRQLTDDPASETNPVWQPASP